MELYNIHKLGKYLLCSIIIFIVLQYISPELELTDSILISSIVSLIFIIIEHCYDLIEKYNKKTNKEDCSTLCSMKENMKNIEKFSIIDEIRLNEEKEEKIENEMKNKVVRRSPQIIQNGSREKDGVIENEEKYNVVSYHTVPQILNSGSFEYGYSFLPPEKWFPTPPFPPVCVTEKQCPVCPYTEGTNIELKEWNSARRITPPDEINVKYIEDKLNSGR